MSDQPSPSHLRRWVALLGALAAGVAATAASCGADDEGIDVGRARVADVSEVVDAPAAITPKASATVTSPAQGRIEQLYVKAGDTVAAGDLIAAIDSPSTEKQLAQAEQALAAVDSGAVAAPSIDLTALRADTDQSAKDAFTAARRNAQALPDPRARAAALAAVQAAEKRYADAVKTADAAIAAVNDGLGQLTDALSALTAAQRVQAQAAVDLAQDAVDALTLRAPVAGTVQLGGASTSGGDLSSLLGQLPPEVASSAAGAVPPAGGTGQSGAPGDSGSGADQAEISTGSLVSSGTAVVTVVDVSALGLAAEVDETDVLLVRSGIAAEVELDAVPGARYAATVRSVDLMPTTSNRGGVSYRVRLVLGPGKLGDGSVAPPPRPGMSAVAKLHVRTASDTVAVPAAAVVRVGRRDAVWVVVDGKATRRSISIGTQGEDLVEVTDGVRAGDRVVVRGADRVREGQQLS